MNNKQELITGLEAQIKIEEASKLALTADIDKRIQSYQDSINYLKSEGAERSNIVVGVNGVSTSTKVKPTLNLIDAVKYVVLNDLKKFESSDTIAHIVHGYLPKKKFEIIKNQISGLLGRWKNNNVIAKYKYGKSHVETVWGHKEWLNELGEPKEGYFTNPKGVVSGQEKNPEQLVLQG